MKRLLGILVLALVAVAALLFSNLRALPPAQTLAAPLAPQGVDEAAVAQRLAGAVRIATVSHGDRKKIDLQQFSAFAGFLRQQFPLLHARLKREEVGPSLLYTWTGSDASARPILLLAHMDVVPVEPGTEGQWTRAPFSGAIEDGHVWGRGTLDDKGSLMAQMEAIESLLSAGHEPARSIYLALGHDEEIGGREGAVKIAQLLKSRGLLFEFALDEGGAITEGIVASVKPPVANIMTAEKGYVSFQLSTRDIGGHSSRPPRQTAVGRLARAVARVQDAPMPARLAAPVTDMLERLAPQMPFGARLAIANRWLLGGQVLESLTANPTTDALVRTTTAPTMFNAGIKDNVLPSEATAVINFRVLPGDSVMAVRDHIIDVVADDEVTVKLHGEFGDEPSPVSDPQSASFRLLERVVRERYPEAVVTTGLVIGATDLRNYAGLYRHRYNFTPFRVRSEDLSRIHGTDERLGVSDYARAIGFYRQLIAEASTAP